MSNLTPRINNLESLDNKIIGGAFDFWQRQISSTATTLGYHTADRWVTFNSGMTSPITQRSTDVPSNSAAKYSLHMQGTPTSNSSRFRIVHRIESANTRDLQGKTVTFSFKYKGSLPSLDTLIAESHVRLYDAAVEDTFPAAGTILAQSVSGFIFDNTWRTISFTYDLSSLTNVRNGIELFMTFEATGAAAQWNFYMTEAMLAVGDTAGVFKRAGKTISDELAMCQRYFQIIGNGTTGAMGSTNKQTGSTYRFNMSLAADMRSTPSVAFQGTAYVIQGVSGQSANQTAAPIVQSIQSGSILLERNVGADHGVGIYVASIAEGKFQLSAEL